MKFSIILASGLDGGIGASGNLPWKCPEDMQFFKNLTINKTIIMGSNTFKSLPDTVNGLKNRFNIVLTSDVNKTDKMKNTNVYCIDSLSKALEYCEQNNHNEIFVVGGSLVYQQALYHPSLENIYWNIIPTKYIDPKLIIDTYFPTSFIECVNTYQFEKTCINDLYCYKFFKQKSLIQNESDELKEEKYVNEEEMQYLNICRKILDEGVLQEGRNGFTKSIFGTSMRFSLENGKIPIFTTKKVAWKTCLKELLWFISGDNSDNTVLQKQNVHIWNGNSTREYLDSIGLTDYEENELGVIYGEQWRHFNQTYIPKKHREKAKELNYDHTKGIEQICDDLDTVHQDMFASYDDIDINQQYISSGLKERYKTIRDKVEFMSRFQPKQNIDQLQHIIDCLKDPVKRYDRRLIMTAHNPSQFHQMVIPPCHAFCQFYVFENKLSCVLYQRSSDGFLGKCFNSCSYSFLTHLIAKHCDLEPYEFIHFVGNDHIYDDHFDQVEEQLKREPFEFPTLEIQNIKENINDYTVEDFKINNYQHHPQIKAKMRA